MISYNRGGSVASYVTDGLEEISKEHTIASNPVKKK